MRHQGPDQSPSYALLESYKVSNLYFYHLDFYRFSDSREWLDAGFRDLLRDDAVVLIEWPERAEGLLPRPTCRFPRLRGRRTRRQPDRVHRPRTNMVERDCPRRQRPAQGRRRPTPPDQRRRHAARPPRIATPRPGRHHPAVRTWPADEYTRVTLELDSELKAEQFTLENPHRLVVDIEGLTINAALNDLVSKVRPDDPYPEPARGAEPAQRGADGVRPEAGGGAAGVHAQARCRLSVPPGAGPVSWSRRIR